jgi:hypothetical protein
MSSILHFGIDRPRRSHNPLRVDDRIQYCFPAPSCALGINDESNTAGLDGIPSRCKRSRHSPTEKCIILHLAVFCLLGIRCQIAC